MRSNYENSFVEKNAVNENINTILENPEFFQCVLKIFGNKPILKLAETPYGLITGFKSSLDRIVIRLDHKNRKIIIVFGADFQNKELIFTIKEIDSKPL